MSSADYVVMERSSNVPAYEENRASTPDEERVDTTANDAASCSPEGSHPTATADVPTLESKKLMLHKYFTSPDFVELVTCASWYLVSYLVPAFLIPSHERPIPYQYLDGSNEYVRNLVNNEEDDGSTVSVELLVLLGVLLPLGVQLVVSWRCSGVVGDTHSTMCAHLVAQGTTRLATEVAKRYVGYLRPIFYAACDPSEDYQTCTSNDAIDARKSFPSGHSSTSFCGLALLTLYLHCRLGMGSVRSLPPVDQRQMAPRTDSRAEPEIMGPGSAHTSCCQRRPRPIMYYRLVSFVSMILPMGLAFFIACSRVVDNKHFPADVVGGAVLGLGVALYVNGMWW